MAREGHKRAGVKRVRPSERTEINRVDEERKQRECERKWAFRLEVKAVHEEMEVHTEEEVLSEREQ